MIMASMRAMAHSDTPGGAPAGSLEERLEGGGIEYFPVCPFQLPEGEERLFLLEQRLASRAHKNISYDPNTGRAAGFARTSTEQAERLGTQAGLPTSQRGGWSRQVLRLFRPGRAQRSLYDSFMLRFHDYLKANDEFQEHGPKRFWSFAPGSAWLVFTDVASHAALRG